VLRAPAQSLAELPVRHLLMRAAVDLLPPFARSLHGLAAPAIIAPAVRSATRGLAGTLRWAFAAESYR